MALLQLGRDVRNVQAKIVLFIAERSRHFDAFFDQARELFDVLISALPANVRASRMVSSRSTVTAALR
ncbi:MAG: hypothetical protein ACI9S9_005074 [Planctomycetota bacterium]